MNTLVNKIIRRDALAKDLNISKNIFNKISKKDSNVTGFVEDVKI
jgi:hypothetical protein